MIVRISAGPDTHRQSEDDQEEKNDYGQCPECVKRVGASYSLAASGGTGYRAGVLQNARDGQMVHAYGASSCEI